MVLLLRRRRTCRPLMILHTKSRMTQKTSEVTLSEDAVPRLFLGNSDRERPWHLRGPVPTTSAFGAQPDALPAATSRSLRERILRPSARAQQLLHVRRHRRGDADRRAILVERHHDLACVQIETGSVRPRGASIIDAVADDRPSHGSAMHAQLMGATGERLECKPSDGTAFVATGGRKPR